MITIAITRPEGSPSSLARQLESWGTLVLSIPTIERQPLLSIENLRLLQGRLTDFDWVILTSPYAVHELLKGYSGVLERQGPHWAVIGESTGQALEAFGLPVDLMPPRYTARHLGGALGDLRSKRILIPRSRLGSPDWVKDLRRRGAEVEDLALYDTVPRPLDDGEWLALEEANGLVFASGSALRSLHDQAKEANRSIPLPEQAVFSIGPSTSAVAKRLGVKVAATANPHTSDGLYRVITSYYQSP